MELRAATKDDCQMLFEWANNKETREMSFSSYPIEWKKHQAWFERKLTDPDSLIYITLNEHDEPVAQIRFEIKKRGVAEVSVNTKPGFRYKGIGTETILLGIDQCFRNLDVSTICAYIKRENIISKKAFEKAGFRELPQKSVKGYKVFHMVKEKDC